MGRVGCWCMCKGMRLVTGGQSGGVVWGWLASVGGASLTHPTKDLILNKSWSQCLVLFNE